jgi:beta-glucosidase
MTEPTDPRRFPDGFLWGAATSAYQIEGSPLADGAGPSIWHRFSHTPGRTANGDTGDVACDHYHRWPEDVRLMAGLGLQSYRFSIAWGRILPEGRGTVNARGLGFYDRLVDALLERGIRPNVTLYHWDLPAALDDRGGWLNPDVADWFADYARVLYRAFDDRVPMWATLNEPWVVSEGGYLHGTMAPGHRVLHEAPLAAHNLLRAHAAAVQAYRADGAHEIGIVVNLEPKYAATESEADQAAARRATAAMNSRYLDPVFLGRYPEELREIFGVGWPEFPQRELDAIRDARIDWMGINYYQRAVVRDDPAELPVREGRVRQPRHTHTTMGWEVYPPGLAETLRWVTERYGRPPIYVTENGAAFYDPPTADGDEVHDPLRVAYLRDHLRAVRDAIRDGADVRGYYAWSLLDNFEWAHGYDQRFGIVHVDFATQRRTPKASARFYAEVIASHGEVLG